MIERHSNPRKQGDAGMGVSIGWFACNGYTVCVPLTDSQRYDLVVDNGNGLKRVSVKTTTAREIQGKSHPYKVGLRTIGSNMYRTKISRFDPLECELLFVVCGDGTKYLIPSSEITVINTLTLSSACDKYKL